jgi:hypothetical protein
MVSPLTCALAPDPRYTMALATSPGVQMRRPDDVGEDAELRLP